MPMTISNNPMDNGDQNAQGSYHLVTAIPRGRLQDIDIAKGIAIFLVVFGHIVAREPPANNEWYVLAKNAIYRFHMAFFMFLSGIIYFRTPRVTESWRAYFGEVKNRLVRLIPAYLLFAGAVFGAKWAAQSFLYVDNPVRGWMDLVRIVLYPMDSVSAFLWYVYVLFLFCFVGLSISTISRGRALPLAIIGAALIFVPATTFLGMDQFCKYLLFFALGGVAARNWSIYSWMLRWLWIPSLLAFGVLLAMSVLGQVGWLPVAIASLLAIHGLCRVIQPIARGLGKLGRASFPIYLMNTLCIGFIKAIMLRLISWDGANFLIYVPILTAAGLAGPIVIKKYILSRISWLDKITS